MPIELPIPMTSLDQDAFSRLDEEVMIHAYAAQNKLGRLFDERVYENMMAKSLRTAGYEVHTQLPVHVFHGSFRKTCYLDLIVNRMVYELKTVTALLPEHEAQALHYAMLADVSRTKLINFRSEKVQGKLCYSALTTEQRRQAEFSTAAWQPNSKDCDRLLRQLRDIIADWGTHLSLRLYNDALVHFNGGEARCLRRVPVGSLGTHVVQSHAPGMAFMLTSLSRGVPDFRRHLARLINHLDLAVMHWFNLNHSTVACESLRPIRQPFRNAK